MLILTAQARSIPRHSFFLMSLLSIDSDASASDSPTLRQRGVREASADDDSVVFNMIGDLDSTPSAMDSQTDLSGSLEQNISEARLRQLYDEEEIDRFLHLFSAVSSCLVCHCTSIPILRHYKYVTEVRLPQAGASVSIEQTNTEPPNKSSLRLPRLPKPPPLPPRPFTRNSEQSVPSTPLPPPLPPRPVELSWSDQIALVSATTAAVVLHSKLLSEIYTTNPSTGTSTGTTLCPKALDAH